MLEPGEGQARDELDGPDVALYLDEATAHQELFIGGAGYLLAEHLPGIFPLFFHCRINKG
jgi:hypothetical protein